MVRKIIAFFLGFLFLGCVATRNEYGKLRFMESKFSIKPNTNENVYKLIDTTKIYELYDAVDTLSNKSLFSIKKQFLKFYNNGRVAEFDYFDKNDIESLNSKKAKMAFYNFEKELIIQFYFEHPQGGGLIKSKFLKSNKEWIELLSGNVLSKYKIIDLPKEFLIYKPDW